MRRTQGRIVLLLPGILSITLLEFSSAGVIKGRVHIGRQVTIESSIVSRELIRRYAKRHLEAQKGEGQDEHTMRAVVYIENVNDQKTYAPPETHPVLDQVNERFVPQVLPIVVGTTVDFPNHDEVYHNVFSFSPAKSFDLGRYPTGHFKSVTFDKPGIVKVYCDIHSQMNAIILVLKNPFFTMTDDGGNFILQNVPSGRYTLKAWYGRSASERQDVVVTESDTVVVNLEIP